MKNDPFDILFICPIRERLYHSTCPNYGQRCLSAYLYEKAGYTSRLFIGNTLEMQHRLKEDAFSGRTSILGFYAIHDNYSIVLHAVRELKELGFTTIIGGAMALSMGEEEQRACKADYIIAGEGEIPLLKLMNYLKRGEGSLEEIGGLRYIDSLGNYHDNGPAELLKNLDMDQFFQDEWEYPSWVDKNILYTMSGRGCPNQCAFCYEGEKRRVRLRSVENVMAELDAHIKAHPQTNMIIFLDDTFTMFSDRVRKFCEELKKRGRKWSCEIHVKKLYEEPELADLMIDSGLIMAQIGIESGSQRVLDAYKKNTTPEMILSVAKHLTATKEVDLTGNLIIGGALETKESLEESTRLAEELIAGCKGAINILGVYYAPYKRTMITTHPEDYEMEIDPYLADCMVDSMQICVTHTQNLSREETQEGMRRFNERIEKAYLKNAGKLTLEELNKLIYRLGGYRRMLHTWKDAIEANEHVINYIRCGYRYHSIFNLKAVPIRTFNDLVYEGEALVVGEYHFKGLERTFLELANGSRTFEEMAARLGVEHKEVYSLYSSLRNKLCVYMERY